MSATETSEKRTWRLSPNLMSFVNQEGVFFETNPAWQTVLGWSVDEIRARTFVDFLHPDDIERTLRVFESMKQGHSALYFENRYLCKNGSYCWLSWVAVQEQNVFYCSARDISADKERRQALKSREDEALLREQFIAILGHDLRNPLAAIGSAVRIASREAHNDKIAAMFTFIEGSADRIAKLIDVTMDFARARLGEGIPVDLRPHENLADGFEQVIDEIRIAHPSRPIEFSHEFEGVIHCDPARLDQLLSNLVSNAVAHGSEAKPIQITTSALNDHFVLSVTNSGKPIPKEAMPNLFEPFSREGGESSLQGLGLGLYITSQIAKAHGGVVEVTSDETETSFQLKIPLPEAD